MPALIAAVICFTAGSIPGGCGVEDPVFQEPWTSDSGLNDETSENFGEVTYTEVRESCLDRNPLRNLYFGDLHAHSSFSADAYLFKNRHSPKEAYLFARGSSLSIASAIYGAESAGETRLEAPLDFAAMTDHSELLGELAVCTNPGSESYDSQPCRGLRGEVPIASVLENESLLKDPERSEEICGSDYSDCFEALETMWSKVQEAAESAYDRTAACSFTTFVGYEYTGAPEGHMLHRNVFFRNANVPKRPTSYFEEPTVPGLWRALVKDCLEAGTGCDAIAIPHNSNLSHGHQFAVAYPDGSSAEEKREMNSLRDRLEPLLEIYQHKGSSECFRQFTSDEACGFENRNFQPCQGDAAEPGVFCAAKIDYFREILAKGLDEGEQIGVNPYRLGVVASTDTHNSTPGNVAEDTFAGHAGLKDFDPLIRLNKALGLSPGGLAGVWAVENSRDALFEAMRRRETFGTSGPRISVRFFGGWSYPAGLCEEKNFVEIGYAGGVPMGGMLPPSPDREKPPVFAVMAEMDGELLQVAQIIKVWVDKDGDSREEVFDVAGDSESTADVDTETCEPGGFGFESLCATWIDPDFDPSKPAAYYARVIENPTCRWSKYTCNTMPPDERPQVCDNEGIIRERAWTSPIWYEP